MARRAKNPWKIFLPLLLFSAALMGCGGKRTGPPPAWLEPGGPLSDERYVYGVGCAQYQIENYFFQRNTARERARVHLAKNLYAVALSSLSGDTTAARRAVEAVLPFHEFSDSYRDEKGNLCVRVRLERKMLDEAIKTSASARRQHAGKAVIRPFF